MIQSISARQALKGHMVAVASKSKSKSKSKKILFIVGTL